MKVLRPFHVEICSLNREYNGMKVILQVRTYNVEWILPCDSNFSLNLQSSCLSFLSSWEYRQVPQCPNTDSKNLIAVVLVPWELFKVGICNLLKCRSCIRLTYTDKCTRCQKISVYRYPNQPQLKLFSHHEDV
jgi:hypothetical protein